MMHQSFCLSKYNNSLDLAIEDTIIDIILIFVYVSLMNLVKCSNDEILSEGSSQH